MAPLLADSCGPVHGSRGPDNTVADGEGAYSRQYGVGSSLGAVTSPTSLSQASGRGGAGGASSLPTPFLRFYPGGTHPARQASPDPHLRPLGPQAVLVAGAVLASGTCLGRDSF